MAGASAPVADGDVGEVLAWEAQHRPRAGLAGVLAGLLTLAGTVVSALALRDRPEVTLFDALRDATGRPPESGGLLVGTADFFNDNAVALNLGQALVGLGGLLAAVIVGYLFLAARARRPGLGQMGLAAAAVGGVAYFVGRVVQQAAVTVSTSDFERTTAGAHDAMQPSAALVGGLIGYVGTLALAVAFVVASLNAMRVGLLTRFMGILGIVSGVLLVIPIASLPVVQAFWLAGAGLLVWGRLPGGQPPAWLSGRAEPWPSRQQLVEARAGAPTPEADPAEPSVAGEPAHPRSKKKKRRR